MIVAPIPILGRKALFPWTLHRLVNSGITPLCIVESDKDRRVVEYYKLPVKQVKSMPLGKKWNIGFQWAREYDPQAVLYLGSGDWVEDDWVDKMYPHLEEYDMVGERGIYFMHRKYNTSSHAHSLKDFTQKIVHWAGYTGDRSGESIGAGRLLSYRILRAM